MCRTRPTQIAFLLLLLIEVSFAAAQDGDDSCPVLVQQALTTVGEVCDELGRNQVCYGNTEVIATDWDQTALAGFASPGDTSPIEQLASLATLPFNPEDSTWGIAMLALQADLPETLPGQNVTFVIYGDAELHSEVSPSDQAPPPPTCTAAPSGNLNLRTGPGTNYAVAGSLGAGSEVTADGRNVAGDWLHLDADGNPVWAYAPLMTLDCDVQTLNLVDADSAPGPQYTAPMQAFRFSAGVGESKCKEAPRAGLLIQAPTDATVHFLINGIELEIGSTALLDLSADDALRASTLAGTVSVTSAGETQEIEPGYQVVTVSNLPPNEPEPYIFDEVRSAPVNLLPETVSIPVTVPGTPYEWTDSDVTVAAGQTFTIVASGQVDGWPQCQTDCPEFFDNCSEICMNTVVGPAGGFGIVSADMGVPFPLPGAMFWALVGRIGDGGQPFLVGEGGTFTAETGGTVQFSINDGQRYDMDTNSGAFIAVIELDKGQ